MSINKDFVDYLVIIMFNNKGKANIKYLFYNRTYFFVYDMKTI